MLEGSCDCGAVHYEVDAPLTAVTECNCDICRRTAALWAYFSPRLVRLSGATDVYMRGDRTLELHRCRGCGCVMWWTPVDQTLDRMGINTRMLPRGALDDIPVNHCDGASW
jgi:hypothetical protein